MIQIRKNIFETNSSSVHALCISKESLWLNDADKKYFESWRKDHKPICIHRGDYGRCPMATLYRFEDKINYLWTAVVDCYYRFYPEFKEDDPEKIQWWRKQLLNVAPINSYFKDVKEEEQNGWYGIDHSDNIRNFLEECEKNPRYIFALLEDSSFIEVTGDEYPNFIYAFLPCIQEQLYTMPGRYDVYVKGC